VRYKNKEKYSLMWGENEYKNFLELKGIKKTRAGIKNLVKDSLFI